MKREFVRKDFVILKISDKEYNFIQIEYSCVYKILVRLFIKGAELNLQNKPKNNIKSSQTNFGIKQIFLREIF